MGWVIIKRKPITFIIKKNSIMFRSKKNVTLIFVLLEGITLCDKNSQIPDNLITKTLIKLRLKICDVGLTLSEYLR